MHLQSSSAIESLLRRQAMAPVLKMMKTVRMISMQRRQSRLTVAWWSKKMAAKSNAKSAGAVSKLVLIHS